MPLIEIDEQLCARDGICVAECPLDLLELSPEKIPVAVAGAETACLRCGHCIVSCPNGALRLDGQDPAGLPAVPSQSIEADAAIGFLASRRSTRNWKDKNVSRELIERAIDAARYAPSGLNMQPVHWLVVETAEEMRRLAGLTADFLRQSGTMAQFVEAFDAGREVILRGAPRLVVAHADAEGWYDPTTDCILALAHFELAAHALGLGTCWAGLFMRAARNWPPLAPALDLPAGHKVYGGLMLGYPKFKSHRLPPRRAARIRYQ
ncbi:MAG: nitroreductase family protein [Thermodesulfobacteriota bacterium]